MSANKIIVEDAALTWLMELGYALGHRQQITLCELLRKATDPHLVEATP